MKTSKTKRNSILLVITALIWGVAFVAQSEGGDAVGPYTFNGIRSLIGGAVLLPVIVLLDRLGFTSRRPETRAEKRTLWTGGICCGAILFIASSLQQLGMYLGTPVGKAGFLTSCYIILVPILGLFLKKTCGWNLGRGCDYRCGLVSALYGWRTVSATFGSSGFSLCSRFCHAHING